MLLLTDRIFILLLSPCRLPYCLKLISSPNTTVLQQHSAWFSLSFVIYLKWKIFSLTTPNFNKGLFHFNFCSVHQRKNVSVHHRMELFRLFTWNFWVLNDHHEHIYWFNVSLYIYSYMCRFYFISAKPVQPLNLRIRARLDNKTTIFTAKITLLPNEFDEQGKTKLNLLPLAEMLDVGKLKTYRWMNNWLVSGIRRNVMAWSVLLI